MDYLQREYRKEIEAIEKNIEQEKAAIEKIRLKSKIVDKAINGFELTIDEIKLMPQQYHQQLLARRTKLP